MHIPVSRNLTYSFLCNVHDAYGLSTLQSLDVVQLKNFTRQASKQYSQGKMSEEIFSLQRLFVKNNRRKKM